MLKSYLMFFSAGFILKNKELAENFTDEGLEDGHYMVDNRDSFDKIFDLCFGWIYPYARKLSNLMAKKGFLPHSQPTGYQGDLKFLLLSSFAGGQIVFLIMFFSKLISH